MNKPLAVVVLLVVLVIAVVPDLYLPVWMLLAIVGTILLYRIWHTLDAIYGEIRRSNPPVVPPNS